ncbi:MAG TPA: DUF488 domain-containing protein, partial [Candidatus Binatia bacterium]|nr:DUF488 domain-containing protein [Candidatus Binatia bacterium]
RRPATSRPRGPPTVRSRRRRGTRPPRRAGSPGPTRHTAWQDRAFRGYADHTDTAAFREAVEGLVRRAREGERLAVLCAELDWRRCHRRLVADALTVRGARVVHLRAGRPPEPHEPHPDLRPDADGWPLWATRTPSPDQPPAPD